MKSSYKFNVLYREKTFRRNLSGKPLLERTKIYFYIKLYHTYTWQSIITFPVYSSGVIIVPKTTGSKYSVTFDLSGNCAGLMIVISFSLYS